MSDLDRLIRERLDVADHEDWCGARIHAECGQDCTCFLGPANEAIRAVLDLGHRPGDIHPGRCYQDGMPWPCATTAVIADALGITQEATDAG